MTLNADGDVVSVTVTESRFTPMDVDILLGSRRLDASRNEHGIPYAEAMDDANQHKFKAVGPRMDWSAEAIRRAKARYDDANKHTDTSSVRWSVEKI